jgi:D-glycero-alpha-D-manno-heptose 1-phosphate guanylyltransferase
MIFLLHHEAKRIENFLDSEKYEGLLKDCNLRILTEPQPLGTGGAVAFAVQQLSLDGSFLIANADTWLGSGIHQVRDSPSPTLAVVRVENSERYGAVEIQQNNVVGFMEKQQSTGPGWINAGLYHLHADLFRDWNGLPFSLERDMFPGLVCEDRLRAISLKTEFIDIGVPTDYFRFCSWIESGKRDTL